MTKQKAIFVKLHIKAKFLEKNLWLGFKASLLSLTNVWLHQPDLLIARRGHFACYMWCSSCCPRDPTPGEAVDNGWMWRNRRFVTISRKTMILSPL